MNLNSDKKQEKQQTDQQQTNINSQKRQEKQQTDQQQTNVNSEKKQEKQQTDQQQTNINSDKKQEKQQTDQQQININSQKKQEKQQTDQQQTNINSQKKQGKQQTDQQQTNINSEKKQEIQQTNETKQLKSKEIQTQTTKQDITPENSNHQETSQQVAEIAQKQDQDLDYDHDKLNEGNVEQQTISTDIQNKNLNNTYGKKGKRARSLLKKAEEIKIQEPIINDSEQIKIGQTDIMKKYYPTQNTIIETQNAEEDEKTFDLSTIHDKNILKTQFNDYSTKKNLLNNQQNQNQWREDLQVGYNKISENSFRSIDSMSSKNQNDLLDYLILFDLSQPYFNDQVINILQLPFTIYDIKKQRPIQDGQFLYTLGTSYYADNVSNRYGAQSLLNESLKSKRTFKESIEDFVKHLDKLKILDSNFVLASFNPFYTLKSLVNESEREKVIMKDFFYSALSICEVWKQVFGEGRFEEIAQSSGIILEHRFDSKKNVEALVKIVQKIQGQNFIFKKLYIQKYQPDDRRKGYHQNNYLQNKQNYPSGSNYKYNNRYK